MNSIGVEGGWRELTDVERVLQTCMVGIDDSDADWLEKRECRQQAQPDLEVLLGSLESGDREAERLGARVLSAGGAGRPRAFSCAATVPNSGAPRDRWFISPSWTNVARPLIPGPPAIGVRRPGVYGPARTAIGSRRDSHQRICRAFLPCSARRSGGATGRRTGRPPEATLL